MGTRLGLYMVKQLRNHSQFALLQQCNTASSDHHTYRLILITPPWKQWRESYLTKCTCREQQCTANGVPILVQAANFANSDYLNQGQILLYCIFAVGMQSVFEIHGI